MCGVTRKFVANFTIPGLSFSLENEVNGIFFARHENKFYDAVVLNV